MNLNQAFNYTKTQLEEGEVLSAKRETRLIFQYLLNISKEEFFINPNRIITNLEKGQIEKTLEQRIKGYPLQYILGKWEFYGLPFYVGEDVLIPRADTEILVGEALEIGKNIKNPKILDLCSGTGCIGIALAKHLREAEVTMVEFSRVAFDYLKKNIELNKVKNVRPILGDILDENFAKRFWGADFDIIVSNPPYIETGDMKTLQKEVMFEPTLALDGGEDGMKFFRGISGLWSKSLKEKGSLLFEIGISQENQVESIAKQNGFVHEKIRIIEDLSRIPRVVVIKK